MGSTLSWTRPWKGTAPFRTAIFDFDGTVSLLRGGWPDLMIELMLQELHPVRHPGETDASVVEQLLSVIRTQIGRATIYQMIRLAEEIQRRGGTPRDPAEVEKDFDARLCRLVAARRDSVSRGEELVDRFMVPGVQPMLEALRQQGISLVLLSGTRLVDLQEEAEFLGIADYFDGGIFGPGPNPEEFCKGRVIAEIAARQSDGAAAIIGFGDGVTETRELAAAGGCVIGIASDEERRSGTIESWKSDILIESGAHLVAPDFADWLNLAEWIKNHAHTQTTVPSTRRAG
jgi:phosphoglycolate phosphatase-like HAD superfamily hydrolase